MTLEAMAKYRPKLDEYLLLLAMQRSVGSARLIASKLGMPRKRASYILEKWCTRGWYDYGVSVDLGWLTTKGKEALL